MTRPHERARSHRRPVALLLALATLVALAFSAAPASAAGAQALPVLEGAPAGAPAGAPDEGDHCRIVLAPRAPGEDTSRVLSHTCSDDRAELGIQADFLLMVWYEGAGYTGESTTIEGAEACNRSGYGIRDTGSVGIPIWRWIISSFRVFNGCNNVTAYDNVNYGGMSQYYWGHTSYVGDRMNDRIESFEIWSDN